MTRILVCGHQAGPPDGVRVCEHLLGEDRPDWITRFLGRGTAFAIVCPECERQPIDDIPLRSICPDCRSRIARGVGEITGEPEVAIRTTHRFIHRSTGIAAPAIEAAAPVEGHGRRDWLLLTTGGELVRLDLDAGDLTPVATLARPPVLDELHYDEVVARRCTAFTEQTELARRRGRPDAHYELERERATRRATTLRAAPDGTLAAVCSRWGRHGVVVDLVSGREVMRLDRGRHHTSASDFPVAFVQTPDGPLLIHGTDWNRLDMTDARTGRSLTPRPSIDPGPGDPRPEHYTTYFHGGLTVSPGGRMVADAAWVMHPLGLVRAWSVAAWLSNPWEADDGPSVRTFADRMEVLDAPMCWLDDRRLAVWGFGDWDEWMLEAARIFDATTGDELGWFPGPVGEFVFDELLFSFSATGTAAWDVDTGERRALDPGLDPIGYHRGRHAFLSVTDGHFVETLVEPAGPV